MHDSRHRAAAGTFLVEGPHAVGEALASDFAVSELFITSAAVSRDPQLLMDAEAAGVAVSVVSDGVAAALSSTQTPQGVVAVVAVPWTDVAAAVQPDARLVAVLADTADPGNVGTIIRTADAAGADAVLLTAGSADPYGDKCVRATAGSIFHLPVVRARTAEVVGVLTAAKLQLLAADVTGDDITAADLDLSRPTAWLFGNEAHGLSDDVLGAGPRRVRLPMFGRAESLNVAAAAAVCLYLSALRRRT